MTKVKIRSPLWIIGSLVSLAAILLGITVGTVLTSKKVPFWPKAWDTRIELHLLGGAVDVDNVWVNPTPRDRYEIKTELCNIMNQTSTFGHSRVLKHDTGPFLIIDSYGWGDWEHGNTNADFCRTDGCFIPPGECWKVNFFFKMSDSWDGSLAQATLYYDGGGESIEQLITFGSGEEPPEDEPDLIIFQIYPDHDSQRIEYTVKNIGDARAGNNYSQLIVDGSEVAVDKVFYLEAGEKSSEVFDDYTWLCTEENDTIKICTDVYKTVDESDEDNNCSSIEKQCGAAPPNKPDLLLEDILPDHQIQSIKYRLKNPTNVNAGASLSKLIIDGAYQAGDAVDPLPANATAVETFANYTWTCTGDSDTIEVYVDVNHEVGETDESNNYLSINAPCAGETPASINGSISIISNNQPYDTVSVNKCDLNDPDDPSKGANCGSSTFLYQGDERTDNAEFPYEFDNLAQGTEYGIIAEAIIAEAWGADFIIEPNYDVHCNETWGNTLCVVTAPATQNLVITLPADSAGAGLRVGGLGHSPPSVDVGDDVRLQFTYSNVGDAPLPGSLGDPYLYVKAYVDDELVLEEGIYEGLGAGESREYTTEGSWTATEGSHSVRTVVESPLLDESDTTDNEAVLAMTVPTPAGEGPGEGPGGPAGEVCNVCGCTASGGDCGGQQCNQKCNDCLVKDREWIADENRYEYAYTYTVLGCLPIKPASFVTWFLRFAMGVGGGIAFLFMVAGTFKVLTSQGDVNKLTGGKKMISRAILGILVIVFAVIILRIIGLDILQLPGFSPET